MPRRFARYDVSRLIVAMLIGTLSSATAFVAPVAASARDDNRARHASDFRTELSKLQINGHVEVLLRDGTTLRGSLDHVGFHSFCVNTRLGVTQVPFTKVRQINAMSKTKMVTLIAAGVGVAIFLYYALVIQIFSQGN